MKATTATALLLSFAICGSCSSTSGSNSSAVFSGSFDTYWQAAQQAYRDLGIKIDGADSMITHGVIVGTASGGGSVTTSVTLVPPDEIKVAVATDDQAPAELEQQLLDRLRR